MKEFFRMLIVNTLSFLFGILLLTTVTYPFVKDYFPKVDSNVTNVEKQSVKKVLSVDKETDNKNDVLIAMAKEYCQSQNKTLADVKIASYGEKQFICSQAQGESGFWISAAEIQLKYRLIQK